MEKALRFIHCADLHLDRPLQGLSDVNHAIAERVRESTFRSFHRIVDTAIEHGVDFIIIAGDLFDSEQHSLRAQARLRDEMARLADACIEVYALHGNHDPLTGDYDGVRWPENVHIFSAGKVEAIPFIKNQETIAYLYGFSYPQRVVTERMCRFYEKIEGASYHIGILHGNLEGRGEHDPYAPFTVHELLRTEMDYWALGHIHKRQLLHEDPSILYAGSIQGLNRKEIGEKGCTLVDMDESGTRLNFIPTADVEWREIEVSVDQVTTVDELLEACENALEAVRCKKVGILTFISFTGSGPLHAYLQEEENVADLLSTLREGEDETDHFVWLVRCVIRTSHSWDRDQFKREGHFIGDIIRMVDEENVPEEALAPLYRNRRAKKFLPPVADLDQESLSREAENLLLSKLLAGRAGHAD